MFLLPLDTFRPTLENAASDALGRAVHIDGPLSLALYPAPGISLAKVSIANAKGSRDAEMVTVDRVVVGAKLLPLLSRHLQVTSVILEKPVIHLETEANGTANWQIDVGKPAQPGGNVDSTLNHIGFRDFRVDGGQITYFDARSGKSKQIGDVSFTLDMPGAGIQGVVQRLDIDGAANYNAKHLKFSGRIDNFGALLAGRPTSAQLSFASDMVNADFSGTLGTSGTISGSLKLGAPSLRDFAAWLGRPLPPGNGFGLIALEGQFTMRDGLYALCHTHLAFDSINLNGDVSLDTKPERPFVKAHISIDRLDLNPYLAPGATDDTVKAVKAKETEPDAPLSLGGLKAADADLLLAVGGLAMPDFKLDQAIVKANLKSGVLKAELQNISAYGGAGSGALTVDVNGTEPKFSESLNVAGLKVQPFLTQLIGVKQIVATGAVKLDLTAHGNRPNEIVKAMSGSGNIRFTDGYIQGVDLAAVARVLQSLLTAQVLTGAVGDNAKTTFGTMGGTFTVAKGVLHTNDLKLTNPTLEMSGKGDVDFTAHVIDLHFEPKANKGIPGIKLVDVGVPFTVKGQWNHPNYIPDVGGLAKKYRPEAGRRCRLAPQIAFRVGKEQNPIGSRRRCPCRSFRAG